MNRLGYISVLISHFFTPATNTPLKANIVLLPGDGIGPEIVTQAQRVLETVAKSFVVADEIRRNTNGYRARRRDDVDSFVTMIFDSDRLNLFQDVRRLMIVAAKRKWLVNYIVHEVIPEHLMLNAMPSRCKRFLSGASRVMCVGWLYALSLSTCTV